MKTKKHLQSIIENLNVIIDEKNSIIDRLLKEKMSATDQYYASLKDQDAIREELFTLRQERLNLNIKSLEERIVQLGADFGKSLFEVTGNIASHSHIAQSDHEEINTSVADLKETLNSFINNQNTENMFNIKKLREREEEISVLKENADRMESTIADLRKNLEGSKANEEALKARLDQLGYAEQQIEKLTKQLNNKDSENLTLKDTVNTITDELERTKHKLTSANGKQGSMAAKIKKLIERLSKYEPNPESDGSERETD